MLSNVGDKWFLMIWQAKKIRLIFGSLFGFCYSSNSFTKSRHTSKMSIQFINFYVLNLKSIFFSDVSQQSREVKLYTDSIINTSLSTHYGTLVWMFLRTKTIVLSFYLYTFWSTYSVLTTFALLIKVFERSKKGFSC